MQTSSRRNISWLLVLGVTLVASAEWRLGTFPSPDVDNSVGSLHSNHNSGDSGDHTSEQIEETFIRAPDLPEGVCCTHKPYNTTSTKPYVKLATESFVDSKTVLRKVWCPGLAGTDLLKVKWCENYRRKTFMSTRQVTKTGHRMIRTETKCDVDSVICCPGRVDVDGQCLTRDEADRMQKLKDETERLLGSLGSVFG